MDSLINSIDNMHLEETFEQKFSLDNSLMNDCSYFVAKVNLHFYQLWGMFMELPCVYNSKKCKYEWKFLHIKSGTVFSIHDWNNKNKLLNTKTWYIGASVNDSNIINEFLHVLCEAIECYNKYYKEPIEQKTFKSDILEVQIALDAIKKSIVQNKVLLQNL